jgi:hypothetical protein
MGMLVLRAGACGIPDFPGPISVMVAFKRKLRLEDNLGGKACDGDDPNGSQRKKL